jgi:paraquat-inducible protein B
LQVGQSQLKFKEIVLGTVRSMDLTPDHSRVLIKVETTRQAEPLISDQTVFWVVKPRLFAGNISGLDTLLSGSYIGMLPPATPGAQQREFVGREDPPVLEANVPGHTFQLKANRLGSISLGSPVFFRDIEVGQVLGWEFANMAESVTIRAFVRAPYDSYVHDETRFWNASGVALKLGGDGVQLQVESLRAILLGGIAFETPPEAEATEVSLDKHVFPLFADRDAANAASYRRKIPVISYFSGSVRGLAPGSEVTMHGLVVGHVTDVRLTFDPAKQAILAPVRYEVEPERILGVGAASVFKTPADAVAAVVGRGLRASLQSANLLTGQQAVALDFDVTAPAGKVTMDGSDFVLQTNEGAGFAGLAAAAATLLDKVNTIPFKQIGDNLDGILSSANSAARSPQMQQALTQLSQTLSGAKDLVAHLDSGLTPALKQLPDMATNLQKTMTNVNKLVSSLDSGYGDNTIFNRQVERLLMQLNDAVGSIRSLVDMLDRHPEALIKGRPVGAVE